MSLASLPEQNSGPSCAELLERTDSDHQSSSMLLDVGMGSTNPADGSDSRSRSSSLQPNRLDDNESGVGEISDSRLEETVNVSESSVSSKTGEQPEARATSNTLPQDTSGGSHQVPDAAAHHTQVEPPRNQSNAVLDDNPASPVTVYQKAWYSRSYSKINRILLDTWLPEALALLFSGACLIAIIVVLIIYHDRQVHRLPKGLTLNTIISVLAAGAKSSLMFAVGGTMSQSKWCWFRTKLNQRRCLHDLEDMDDASRGPLGSTIMLFQHTVLSLCSIGAVLVILALAFDPFVQQVVGYPVRQETSSSSEAITRQAFTLNSVTASDEMAGNVYAGIYHDNFDRAPSCPTGNCTWDPFLSAGWCGKCEQLAPEQVTSEDCNFSFEDAFGNSEAQNRECHFSISGGDPLPANFTTTFDDRGLHQAFMTYSSTWLMSQFGNPVRTYEYAEQYFAQEHIYLGERNPLMAFGYIYFQNVTATEAISTSKSFDMRTPLPNMMNATTCILTPCTRKYNVTVTNGNTTVETLSEDYGTLSPRYYGGQLCWRPKSLLVQPPTSIDVTRSTYSLAFNDTNMAWCGLDSGWISEISTPLQGSNLITFSPNTYDEGRVEVRTNAHYNGAVEQTPTAHIDAVGGLDQVFPGILNALTDGSLHATEPDNNLAVNFLNGTILTEKVFVVVSWAWLSLPIALILGGVCFLWITMRATRRHSVPLWKSSALSFLYHGLTENAMNEDSVYGTRSDMEEAAQMVSVRLNPVPARRGRIMLHP